MRARDTQTCAMSASVPPRSSSGSAGPIAVIDVEDSLQMNAPRSSLVQFAKSAYFA